MTTDFLNWREWQSYKYWQRVFVEILVNLKYKFQNVPIGDYRVVIASDYSRLVLDSPADFAKNATQATEIQASTLPRYIIVDPDIVANGMNALNAVEPTTLNLSIRDNSVYLSDFFRPC